jgi:signal peptidase I
MADVVVCEHPVRAQQLIVGRAIAFAGHQVHADRFGTVLVDDDRTTQEVVGRVRFYDVTRKKQFEMGLGKISYFGRHDHEFFAEKGVPLRMRPYTVTRGAYLLGDNRSVSGFDSRSFGEVDTQRCLGQVFMRWKPAPDRGDDLDHHMLELIR